MFEGLPNWCYQTFFGRTVIIIRNEPGYHLVDLDTPAKILNRHIDVSPAQAEAMFIGCMLGWDMPGANPALYDENGIIIFKERRATYENNI